MLIFRSQINDFGLKRLVDGVKKGMKRTYEVKRTKKLVSGVVQVKVGHEHL